MFGHFSGFKFVRTALRRKNEFHDCRKIIAQTLAMFIIWKSWMSVQGTSVPGNWFTLRRRCYWEFSSSRSNIGSGVSVVTTMSIEVDSKSTAIKMLCTPIKVYCVCNILRNRMPQITITKIIFCNVYYMMF